MSLFDVLRWPISDEPTKEELEALPCSLFKEWMSEVGFVPANWSHENVAWYYRKERLAIKIAVHDIRVLRKMIEEYNEPI